MSRLPKAVDRREQLARIAPLLGQLAGAGIGLSRLSRNKPSDREQRQTSGQLQFDLLPVARRAFGQCRKCRKTALEMSYRLAMGGALGRILAGLEPLIDRTLRVAGGGQMVSQEFGLTFDKIGEV